jgi:hypothetical protein
MSQCLDIVSSICYPLVYAPVSSYVVCSPRPGLQVNSLLERTKQPCHQCMKDAGVVPKDINEVWMACQVGA